MVNDPQTGEIYEWRREGHEPVKVRITGVVPIGDTGIHYPTPDPQKLQTFDPPTTPIQDRYEAVILDGPHANKVVKALSKTELFEIR